MYDCKKEITSYHDNKVTLPQSERTAMRDRRNANRDRIKDGLKRDEKPSPLEFVSQGSYAMKTMVQHPAKGYDIDDGVYFDKEDLKDSNDAYMSASQARNMIRDAVDDGSFKTAPEVCKNCVRVHYEAGYHVDIPVYRRVVVNAGKSNEEVYFELAAADWKRSDARDVTKWFDEENQKLSPDDTNGRQFRRITRLLKKFAQSRPEWKDKMASGFMNTKLNSECYSADSDREDKALYDTMKAIRDRLSKNLIVEHPVTPDSTITDGDSDPKAIFLKDKLSEAITDLDVLFKSDCKKNDALKAWDKVFNTSYFMDNFAEKDEDQKQKSQAAANSASITSWATSSEPKGPVNKKGNNEYA